MPALTTPDFPGGNLPLTDEEWVAALLAEVEQDAKNGIDATHAAAKPVISREALLALARVLTRPTARVFRVASSSNPSQHYTLTYEANEVTCNCPGFEFRGMCRHARSLKDALVKQGTAPADFTEVLASGSATSPRCALELAQPD